MPECAVQRLGGSAPGAGVSGGATGQVRHWNSRTDRREADGEGDVNEGVDNCSAMCGRRCINKHDVG